MAKQASKPEDAGACWRGCGVRGGSRRAWGGARGARVERQVGVAVQTDETDVAADAAADDAAADDAAACDGGGGQGWRRLVQAARLRRQRVQPDRERLSGLAGVR